MKISWSIITLLLIFYSVFVLGDILTTFWLIKYYPSGISGEANPLAHLIFTKYKYLGMFASKIISFLIFSISFIFIYNKYGYIKWLKDVLETLILSLTGLSILVITNNLISIIAISYFIYKTQPTWILKMLVYLISIIIASSSAFVLLKSKRYISEAIIGCTIAYAPLFFWPTLNPLLYITYLILLIIIVVTLIYYFKLIVKK